MSTRSFPTEDPATSFDGLRDETSGMVDPQPRKKAPVSSPMDEENFPDSPTRRSADKQMAEPDNVPSSADPVPHKRAPVREDDDAH